MVSVRHTRASVVERVDKEYRALDHAVRAVAREGLDRPVPGFGARARIKRERWTYKDALVHILTWKDWQIRALQHVPQDPTMRGLTIAQKNRRIYDRWHRRPATEVVAWHRQLHREILRTLRAVPDAAFSAKRSPYWPNDLVGHSEAHRKRHLEAR